MPNITTLLLLFSLSVMSWLFVTPWTIAHQAPLSMRFSRQEYWSGLPFPSLQGIFSTQGSNPHLLYHRWFFTTEPPGKPHLVVVFAKFDWLASICCSSYWNPMNNFKFFCQSNIFLCMREDLIQKDSEFSFGLLNNLINEEEWLTWTHWKTI